MNQLCFHGQDVPPSPPEKALFHILPAPFEYSVSYGTGTALGPMAILEASQQLELFDGKSVPADHGIYTSQAIDCSGTVESVLSRIEECCSVSLSLGKMPVLLGGEHTITCGAANALKKHHHPSFGVVQFDAHADLRNQYEGSAYSHACVMRRIHEQGIPIYQLGTRSYSLEEMQYRKLHNIAFRDAEDICKNGIYLNLPPDFPEKIFLSFDIDGLDSSLVPATGTPVPGGLSWYQALWMIEALLESRICLGFDLVELAPLAGQHGPNFTAAQLVYQIMGIISRSSVNQRYWQL